MLGTSWHDRAAAQPEAARALDEVQNRIEAVSKELESQRRSRDANAQELKSIELELASTTRELDELDERVEALEVRQRELDEQTAAAEQRLGAERDALAEQVRMSYMTGREELFKLLMSQENPAELGRMMVYYDYLNRARSSRIDVVGRELASLERLSEESELVAARLERLRAEAAAERERLEQQRGERTALLERLEDSIASAGEELEQLEREEQRLEELLEQLDEATAAFPVNVDEPFGELRGRLVWPVPGRLAADFGEPRNGGPMRWNGVVLDSPAGTPVRAVYNGRVAFADWLTGLGLLVIIDHGDGYMTLYGHNQALYTEAGDWVAPGEAIAVVGDSGGRARPSLYFEIRRGGDPVNPHEWVPGQPEPP